MRRRENEPKNISITHDSEVPTLFGAQIPKWWFYQWLQTTWDHREQHSLIPRLLPVFLGRSLGARQQLKESRKNWPLEPITQAMILRYWGLHAGSWLQRSDKPGWLPAPKDHPEYHRLNSQFNGLNMNSLGKGTFCWAPLKTIFWLHVYCQQRRMLSSIFTLTLLHFSAINLFIPCTTTLSDKESINTVSSKVMCSL